MSQVTEQSVRFQTALASIKLIQASAVLDLTEDDLDRKSGSAGMPRPISYAVFCLKKKTESYCIVAFPPPLKSKKGALKLVRVGLCAGQSTLSTKIAP